MLILVALPGSISTYMPSRILELILIFSGSGRKSISLDVQLHGNGRLTHSSSSYGGGGQGQGQGQGLGHGIGVGLAKSAASCGQDGMPGLIYLPSILLRWKHSPCPRRLTEPEALQ
uniref:HDC15931 n=1 Tax=Drosophila melanogaster TaxID=7227 RepID=Q6IJ47_DROME|nr:TPA_inf: HDC15931 [Drosophila melanogaster]